ncbi:hypothetical protein D4764_10G0002140 [Takifugu flavidus]|uniref:Uncharacterized protein n=1 Tax=Takifugu flavidus TaxID=433684 RepID=A0A5C6PH69_9TELE|nr:hypothetical protein D4764_10G0002140 [Takifugu flavidus]
MAMTREGRVEGRRSQAATAEEVKETLVDEVARRTVFVPLQRFHVGSSCLSKAVKVFPVYQGPDVAGPAVADGQRAKRRTVCENGELDSA